MKVSDIMTSQVVSVPPTMRLKSLAELLAESGISGVPVVEDDGTVVGVISEYDLVEKQATKPMRRPSLLEWRFDPASRASKARRHATMVGQAMHAPAITVEPDCPVRDAATLMLRHNVKRLPVTTAGRLVGVVTRADLVRAYVRRDDEILRAIRDGVVRDTMWLDPGDLDIEVTEGLVRLAGRVDRRSTATIIGKLVGLVDGVAGVESNLTWDFDDQHLSPSAGVREPSAASLAAREPLRPLHG